MEQTRNKTTKLTVRGGKSPSGSEYAPGNSSPYGATWSVSYREEGMGDLAYREITSERLLDPNASKPRGGWRKFESFGPKAVVIA